MQVGGSQIRIAVIHIWFNQLHFFDWGQLWLCRGVLLKPRSGAVVMIDDRVTMREAPRGTRLGESPQASAAANAYLRFGLEASTKKRVRDAAETEF